MKKIIIIIVLLIFIWICGEKINHRLSITNDFKKIIMDFEIVNEFLIDYYDKNCEEKCYDNQDMVFDIVDNQDKIELVLNFSKNKFEVDDKISKSIINIEKYYVTKVSGFSPDRMNYIRVNEKTIKYYSETHPPMVIYYRNGKPTLKEIRENNLEHILDNWYKTKYEHHM